MKQDISLLFEGIQGLRGWLDSITSAYNWTHYRFEAVGPRSDGDMPRLKVFPDSRYPNRHFSISPDLERDLWVRSNGESETDQLPLELYPVMFPWVFEAIASSHEDLITKALSEPADKAGDGDSSKSLSAQVQLWGFAVRLLIEVATGGLDDMLEPHPQENRAEARLRLPHHVDLFWRWLDSGLENRLLKNALDNVEFLKSEFRRAGFADHYQFDLFQVASELGESLAEATIREALKARQENQAAETQQMNRKVLGWVVPLTIGSIIAIGAALGY